MWIADSQSVFRDAFASLTLCAAATERIRIASGVTNPVTRHPAVLAGFFATLAELSAGRAVLGIGAGESSVRTLGRGPAKLDEVERCVTAVRALLAGDAAGGTRMSWRAPRVPIVVAASAPRMLELAGRVGDGVLFQVGADPALVRYALDRIDAGARAAGRDPADVERSLRVACHVDQDVRRAREAVAPYAAVAANTVARSVPRAAIPESLHGDLDRLRAGYDYRRHGYRDAPHLRLVTEELVAATAVAGPGEAVAARFRELAVLGVDRFVVPLDLAERVPQARELAAALDLVAKSH